MKKFFSIVMMIAALTVNVSAQNNNSAKGHNGLNGKHHVEMNIEQVAQHVARQIDLDEKATEKFVPIYKAYKEEKRELMQKYAKKRTNPQLMTDDDVVKANKDKFARKRAMLDLEENYYKKFTKVMNDRQYNVMMKMDRKHHRNHFGKVHHKHHVGMNHNRSDFPKQGRM